MKMPMKNFFFLTEKPLDKKSLNSDEANGPCEYAIEKKRNCISKYGK